MVIARENGVVSQNCELFRGEKHFAVGVRGMPVLVEKLKQDQF